MPTALIEAAGGRNIMDDLEKSWSEIGWEPVVEGNNPIALLRGKASITLEPGGQFELSGAPVENVHQTAAELFAHLAQLREVAGPLGIGFLGIGGQRRQADDRNCYYFFHFLLTCIFL